MTASVRRALWLLGSVVLFGVMAYAYHRYVWSVPGDQFAWTHEGRAYRLLTPRWLGMVLLGPWFIAVLGWSLADLPWQQRMLSACVRIGFCCALALALAQPERTSQTDRVCAVYLVDVSDSVTDESLADANQWLAEAWAKRRPGDVMEVVGFARHAKSVASKPAVDGAPLSVAVVKRHQGTVPTQSVKGAGAESNLQAALQLAYGLYPPGCLRRAVLISDGRQTRGDLLAEAGRARDFGVKVYAMPYKRPAPAEVAVTGLQLPARVKVGEGFKIDVRVFSSRKTKARARLYQGETLNGLDGVRDIELNSGDNTLTFESVVRLPGEVTYRVVLDKLAKDRFKENNHYAASVDVPGRPQVLYVDGTPHHSATLARALTAQQYDVDVRPPSGFPASLRELERFDFVIVSDVSRRAFGEASQDLLERYLRDLGGGLLYAGGPNAYGLGGWQRSKMARLLPVYMEGQKRREMPSVAMTLVIDRSG
ncbi:MAG: vWA domain-containing protein, partial [Polyangiaceae bacterium]